MSAIHGVDIIKIMSGAPQVGSSSKNSTPKQPPELRTQKKGQKNLLSVTADFRI